MVENRRTNPVALLCAAIALLIGMTLLWVVVAGPVPLARGLIHWGLADGPIWLTATAINGLRLVMAFAALIWAGLAVIVQRRTANEGPS